MLGSIAFLHTRAGFELEAGQEFIDLMEAKSIDVGKVRVVEVSENAAAIVLQFDTLLNKDLVTKIFDQCVHLVFSRQLTLGFGPITLEAGSDRIDKIMALIVDQLMTFADTNAFSGFEIEPTDNDEIKSLEKFCKSLSRPLENRLNKAKLLPKGPGAKRLPKLVIVLTTAEMFWVTFKRDENETVARMGIPRLKFPLDAPSRSTLKLEEALLTFLGRDQMNRHLKEGMSSVDLGASPGGWTYQLVKRGLTVIAVDNGPMDNRLMSSGKVNHLKVDALSFKPHKPVDWMVCDVVESPHAMTEVICRWIENKWANHIVFNVKLPMKKRLDEVKQVLKMIEASSLKTHKKEGFVLKAKQLYHDRKEVTIYWGVIALSQ